MTDFSFKKIDAPGPAGTFAYISVDGVDTAGLAVGNFGNDDGDGDSTFHGFAAQAGGSYTIDDPPGSSNTDIVGITPGGEIFGDYVDFSNKQHGFVENDGVVTNVDMFLANSTVVYGVNAAGVIYGTYASSTNGVFGFTDNNGSFALVAVPGAFSTSVVGMNASGAIVGTYTDAQSVAHGYVDNNGSYTSFDPQGSISTSVVGISDAGLIVGNYQDSSNNTHGFIDNNGVIATINIAGATSTGVQAINAAGEIVGYYIDGSSHVHGFIDNGGAITTVDVPGATYTDIVGISATGVISGYYDDSSFTQHGFVGTPAPTVIESFGSTSLVQVGNNYYLDDNSSGTGPELQYNGAPVVPGEFSAAGGASWTPIGVEQTSTGYEVAWTVAGTNQYSVWSTDSSGNYTGNYFQPGSGTSSVLESLETSFHQDLNGDGVIGVAPTDVIESFGSTSLIQIGNNYYLVNNSTGVGPELQYDGAPVVPGEFSAAGGAWTPIGVEQTSTGYEVAWKAAGLNEYSVWSTDSNGNNTGNYYQPGPGNSSALESLETSFHQDLNGDGVIGIPGTTIESFGSTSLVQVGNNYYLDNNSGGSGPELKYNGAPVVPGEFSAAGGASWTPIGTEQTSTGYEVAWTVVGTNQYSVWSTDSSGNYTGNYYQPGPGNSSALESLETSFHQDLNGDGVIGIPGTIIESFGSTSLVQVSNNYYLDNNGSGTGPELKYNGAPVVPGEFSAAGGASWTPIGTEQTSTGYEVAWTVMGTNQYSVWSTDSNGNYTGNYFQPGPSSSALESLETSFHQDLNGDGVIGIPGTTIESFGSTSLVQVGNNYYLDNNSTGVGPELQYDGAPVVPGEFSASGGASWTPIGAEQTSTGYEVAWTVAGTDQYSVWTTDSSGNCTGNYYQPGPGNSSVLESLETSFHQDLNGDGVIGQAVATAGTLDVAGTDSGTVQFSGATGTLILEQSTSFSGQLLDFTGNGNLSSSDQLDLRDIGYGAGTTVGYAGTAASGTLTITDAQNHTAHIVLDGDYTSSTFSLSSDNDGGTIVIDPADNQAAADGTLSFSDPNPTDTHSVSVASQNGGAGYLGSFVAGAADTANGQDTVGWHFNFDSAPVTQTVTQSYAVTVTDHEANGATSAATQMVSVTIAGPGNDAFVFHPGVGSDTIINATSADSIELDGFSAVTSNHQLASLLAEAQAGQSQSLFQSVNGGHDTVIDLGNHDSITLSGVQIADLHASNFIIH